MREENGMEEFWETIIGRRFYKEQFPALIESLNKLAKVNEELCEAIREQNSLVKTKSEQNYGADKLDC